MTYGEKLVHLRYTVDSIGRLSSLSPYHWRDREMIGSVAEALIYFEDPDDHELDKTLWTAIQEALTFDGDWPTPYDQLRACVVMVAYHARLKRNHYSFTPLKDIPEELYI